MRSRVTQLRAGLFLLAGLLVFVHAAVPLTVERVSLERLTRSSQLIVRGKVLRSISRWEDRNIYTYTTIRVLESLKGGAQPEITVKQMGGTVGEISEVISGAPELQNGEEVILFLVSWKNNYWIHSIVLGKFSVVLENGAPVAYNNLNNVGLIDPVTKREVTGPSARINAFPLVPFVSEIRSYSSQ
jgi:hypothetical protein